SDALGHVFTMIGKDWTHSGVAKLYSDIHKNGYQILYLTSRAIGQADYTRDYLEKVKQDKYQLPEGPVIMSPDRLLTAFHREVIMRKPEAFKIACLRDVRKLFGDRNPFFAGFGNRITDALSYRSVNIPSSKIFTIDTNGEVKLELLAGYKSSYVDLSDLVDQIFPHIDSKWDTIYNDWNYWKSDLPEIELPPEIYEISTLSPQKSQPSSPRLGSNDLRPTHLHSAPGMLETSASISTKFSDSDFEDQYGEEDDSDFEADVPAEIDLREYPY
ncbi:32465_t:CDS:2, partial [Racocetra persica]